MEQGLITSFRWPLVVLLLSIVFILIFRNEIREFIKEVSWLKTKWFELRRIKEEIFAKAEEVQRLAKEIDQDKKELRESTKAFIESIYLSVATRNVFPIPKRVQKEIENNLNNLASFAVEAPAKREEWIERINKVINPNWSKK